MRAGSPAPPKYNLVGRWTVGGNDGAEKGGMHITRMSMSTCRFTGTSYAGRLVVKGREIGTSITVMHIVGAYVSTDIGRITDGGRKMGGLPGHQRPHRHLVRRQAQAPPSARVTIR